MRRSNFILNWLKKNLPLLHLAKLPPVPAAIEAVLLLIHGGDGGKELARDIGEYGGAARGDTILAEQEKEAGTELADGSGGLDSVRLLVRAASESASSPGSD